MRAVIAVDVAVLLIGGCGGGDFLLTTNRGFFRIDPEKGSVARVRGSVSAGWASAPVGAFLELLSTGPGQLLGSGHPDRTGALPGFLGLLSSDDSGRSWRSVSRLGEVPSEPYRFKARGPEALDLALSDGTIVSTRDGGKTWKAAFRP